MEVFDDEELNDYERARAALIARNRERMAAMGLLDAAAAVFGTKAQALKATRPTSTSSTSLSSSMEKKTQPRPRPRPRLHKGEQPTRVSKRLRGENAPGFSDDVKTEEEDGEEKPRPPSPPRWTEAELSDLRADEARRRRAAMDERLAELDIAGLIDYSPGIAHFAIIGAPHKGQKGRKHYKVTFSNRGGGGGGGEGGGGKKEKATPPTTTKTETACECVDFRIRRKRSGGHCKHIRLVLTQLGIDDDDGGYEDDEVKKKKKGSIEGWEGALERVVMASASARK